MSLVNVRIARMISGGQTGADQGGLEAAEDLGIATGGWMPRGWLTETGSNPALAQRFGLMEHDSPRYPPRTERNILDADATLVVATAFDGGTALTVRLARRHGKPLLCISFGAPDAIATLDAWLDATRPAVLNVAGNRESRTPGIQSWVRATVREALARRVA